jgi:hypothetical protein
MGTGRLYGAVPRDQLGGCLGRLGRSAGLSAEGITSCFEHVLNTIEQSGSVRADRGD